MITKKKSKYYDFSKTEDINDACTRFNGLIPSIKNGAGINLDDLKGIYEHYDDTGLKYIRIDIK